ncbi:MAG: helix-turn-helix transcriptional regulator [Odoribacteraceae bacterium]|nr:helix-turn-helix transcriptional regulator [Odoribacteraceae bacterium]
MKEHHIKEYDDTLPPLLPDAFREILERVAGALEELLDGETDVARRQELALTLEDARSLSRYFPIPDGSSPGKFLQRVTFLVEQNIGNAAYSVDDLAPAIGLSRSSLYRHLYLTTGLTPSLFIRQARLQRAARLLRETSSRISEVAEQVGFNGLKYFNRHFKEVFGVTPSVYRKKGGRTGEER